MKKEFKYDPQIHHVHSLAELFIEARLALGVNELSPKMKDELEIAWIEAKHKCHVISKTYTVYFHQDVQGYFNVEADNATEAKKKVRQILDNEGIGINDYTCFDKDAKICKNVELDEWEEEGNE